MQSTRQVTRERSRQIAWLARQRRRGNGLDRSYAAAAELELPACCVQDVPVAATSSSSRLVCGSGCAAARLPLRDEQVIGMPSRAVDEPWGLDLARVAEIQAAMTKLLPGDRN